MASFFRKLLRNSYYGIFTMRKYIAFILYFMICQSCFAWSAIKMDYDQLEWAPDSKSFIFNGYCDAMGDGDCIKDMTFQYVFKNEKMINLTPSMNGYMLSTSKKWLVFSDWYGVYLVKLSDTWKVDSKVLQIHFETNHAFSRFHNTYQWGFVGFSKDESDFIYFYVDDKNKKIYYKSSVFKDKQSGTYSYVLKKINSDIKFNNYNYSNIYFDYTIHDDILKNKLENINLNLIPNWNSKTNINQKSCRPNSVNYKNKDMYTLILAQGKRKSDYVRLQKYAEYLDSLYIRTQLIEDEKQKELYLYLEHFSDLNIVKSMQKCLLNTFELNTKIIKQKWKSNNRDYHHVPLRSWGRITSPDNTKTIYMKHFFTGTYDGLTEIWLDTHDKIGGHQDEALIYPLTNR
jgi:hypothetical protein